MGFAFGSSVPELPDDSLPAPAVAEAQLSAEVLYDGVELAMPTQIAMAGGWVALTDGFAERPVHILDLGGHYVAGLGSSGEGPGEFEWPRAIEPSEDGQGFWVYDNGLSRLTLVEPDRWGVIPASARVTVPIRAPSMVMGVVHAPGEGYLATGFFGEGRLGHFDEEGSYEGASGVIPESLVEAPAEVRQHAYRGTLKTDPTGTRVVLANRHAGFLEVFTAEGQPVSRIEGPYDFEPPIRIKAGESGPSFASGEDLRFGYMDVAPTEDRIYALFSGRTRAGHPDAATYGRTVHVFDWDGQLLEALTLDADVMAIAVDEERGRLLAVRHLPTPALLSYPLPASRDAGAGLRMAD
jgi:hypothetical protein